MAFNKHETRARNHKNGLSKVPSELHGVSNRARIAAKKARISSVKINFKLSRKLIDLVESSGLENLTRKQRSEFSKIQSKLTLGVRDSITKGTCPNIEEIKYLFELLVKINPVAASRLTNQYKFRGFKKNN